MSHELFSTSPRRDPAQAQSLRSRIDAQLVERIEEAVDFVCLDALVEGRRAHGLAVPVADNAQDRAAFEDGVRTFLGHLERSLLPALTPEQRRHVPDDAERRSERDRVAIQVALAKALPDYWQRFDQLRAVYTAERIASPSPPGPATPRSGRERPGRLRRLLGGG